MKVPAFFLGLAGWSASAILSAQTPGPAASIEPAATLAATATPGPAPEALATPADVTVMINQFFKTLRKGDIDRAYEALTRDTKFASGPGELETLKKKTSEAIRLYGVIRGNETADFQAVGTHLVRVTSISLGAELPLRWRFYFYQGAGGWKLIDLRVDDRLVDLFGEKAPGAPAEAAADPSASPAP